MARDKITHLSTDTKLEISLVLVGIALVLLFVAYRLAAG